MKQFIYMLFAVVVSATANSYGQNLVWVKQCSPNQKETYTVAFSADGKKLFSGSEHLPTSVRIFDAGNGDILWDDTLAGGLMCAQDVQFTFNDSKIIALEEYGNVMIYNNTHPQPTLVKSFKLPGSYAFSVSISPDGEKFAVGCSGKKLLTYTTHDGSPLRNVDAHLNYIYGTDWSVNNEIATCGDDLLVKLWDSAGNAIRTFSGHTGAVTCVKFSPDGSKLVSASKDKTIKIWDVATGSLINTLTGHSKFIKQLDISDDGTMIVSCSEDETIKTWDIATGVMDKSFGTPGCGIVYSVEFKPGTTRYVAAGASNGDVQLWDLLFPAGIVESTSQATIHAYPNPFAGSLVVTGIEGDVKKLTLIHADGRISEPQVTYMNGTATCNTELLPPGNYILMVETDKETITRKITKQ